jgi:microcystin-dependent protein
MDQYIGQLMLFAGNFAPRGWAFCHGQLLSIAQNSALFSLLGTTYGGDGQTTFGVPDLRGRAPIGMGQGPGLPNITQGQQGGAAAVTLTTAQMPAHSTPSLWQGRKRTLTRRLQLGSRAQRLLVAFLQRRCLSREEKLRFLSIHREAFRPLLRIRAKVYWAMLLLRYIVAAQLMVFIQARGFP